MWSDGHIVNQWVTQDTKGSKDNSRRPGRGSTMRQTINEESDCLREKICVGTLVAINHLMIYSLSTTLFLRALKF